MGRVGSAQPEGSAKQHFYEISLKCRRKATPGGVLRLDAAQIVKSKLGDHARVRTRHVNTAVRIHLLEVNNGSGFSVIAKAKTWRDLLKAAKLL
jgi:hypothetical protein